MLPDRVSNPGPLTYESGALPIALRGLPILSFCSENNDMTKKSMQKLEKRRSDTAITTP